MELKLLSCLSSTSRKTRCQTQCVQAVSTIKHQLVSVGSESPSPRKFPRGGMEPSFTHPEVSCPSGGRVLNLQIVSFRVWTMWEPPLHAGLLRQEL